MEDETNHGILLRVNSGGGTVFHSDEMYLKLMKSEKNPLVEESNECVAK